MSRQPFYDSTADYPRDLLGYGEAGFDPMWPGGARIAVQFVLNYEEGGESNVLHGDPAAETFLSEMFNPAPYPDRHMSMDGVYEYGSRQGVWRILREFDRFGLPLTVFGVATALQRNPAVAEAFAARGYDIVCHGLRWIHYQDVPEDVEREHMSRSLDIIEGLTGTRPVGWYTGRDSPNTRRLVADDGRLLYDSDYYGDDLPFWMLVETSAGERRPHLVVPYTLDCNDMRYALPQGFSDAEPFYRYLRDQFDVLYDEGDPEGPARPAMMSIGLHCRMVGRPGRIVALRRFLDHISAKDGVWVATREAIAEHWLTAHPWSGR
ncbi:putative urate catabolism protein [Brevibacterium sanguinis]|uniref:Urate catabolism protein n=2 Tax=Brevibacterium TaxID=1696 RepID=A0ABX9GPI3_9MICO|nr:MULTISPECIES: allantoinase PuuE [Brevibacterium]RBP64945.1 putative urate catabolism protein [Brevibacterium sanguinis]RBP71208.1 putative urate catabolism protein [Brevibacterium celere]